MFDPKKLGLTLAVKREGMKISQEKLAELCDLSPRHYHNLELGRVNPTLGTAMRLAKTLDFSLDALNSESEDGES